MILLIDNYDSFSYNLYQLVGSIEPDIKVIRNDAMTVGDIEKMNPDGIIISPGPGRPEDSGICPEVIRKLGSRFPILGVCLGHQAICMTYGATVSYTTLDTDCELFNGCSRITPVARYHSLAAVEETMPECLSVTARTADGEIMAVKHMEYPVYGVQFHPESIMTPEGKQMLRNFIELAGRKQADA